MKLGITVWKVMLILLQLTSVMPKRRVKYISTEDTSLEDHILYYKKCKAIGKVKHKDYDGARSDRESGDKENKPKQVQNVASTPPWTEPTPTLPPRKVMKLECKICVTVCCGEDCECKEQPMLQSAKVLQLEQELQCKTCYTMCCGEDCKCKEQLLPQSHTLLPKSEQSIEKENKVLTPTRANFTNIDTLKSMMSDIKLHGDKIITYEGPVKVITQNITHIPSGMKGTLKRKVIETASGEKLFSNVISLNSETGRRSLGTRDYIKNVITHDGDISAIMKDLVRVTLQKVDMMKKIDTRRNKAIENTNGENSDSNF